jgi:outer membrane receptor protein involved in Fe transport
MNSGHAELNFLWNTSNSSQLGGKVYYYDNDRQLPGQVFYYSNTSRETLRDRNVFGQLTFQQRWGEQWSLKLLAKYNWAASLYDDGIVAGWVQDGDYYQREAYTSLALLYTPTEHWAFDYSADYAHNNLNSTLPTDTRPYRNTILQSATVKYHLGKLTVMGRLLYSLYLNGACDGDGAEDMRRLSPSLSLSFELLPQLHLRASYKEIFRAPTFNENYFFHYGSKDLKAENTQQLNAGVTYAGKLSHNTDLTATADLYYNKVTDMIQGVPHNMFVWTCMNIGKAEILGLDVTAKAAHAMGRHTLTAAVNYSMQRARNHTNPESPFYDNQLAYMPLHSGAGSLSWENPWVNISISGHAIGERWSTNEHQNSTHINGYSEVGATIWRRFHIGRPVAEIRFDIKNLFDKQYEIVRSYPMPGRSWQLTVNVKF